MVEESLGLPKGFLRNENKEKIRRTILSVMVSNRSAVCMHHGEDQPHSSGL